MAPKFFFEPIDNKSATVSKEVVIPHIDNPPVISFGEMLDATEAYIRDVDKNPPAGVVTSACGNDNSPNVCAFKNNCPRLKAYDEFIYSRLRENEVTAIEVRWCGGYEPKNAWTNIDEYKESIKVKTEHMNKRKI